MYALVYASRLSLLPVSFPAFLLTFTDYMEKKKNG